TVPAGTAARVKRTVQRMRPKDLPELEVASNPEFLREGKAIEDNLNPDRILVGAESDHAREALRGVYRPWLDEGYTYIETDIATAELSKHACNAFLAMKISYVNALARLCERAGADVTQVAEVMGSDPRIGRAFLDAGLGYGGFCFPKDIQAFERLSHRLGYDFGLLREVARVNVEAVDAAFDKVVDALWNLEGKRVLLLGLAFKPNTDDVRLSPALALAERLMTSGAEVVGYDPQAANEAKAELPTLEILPDLDEAFNNAHAVVLCTEWSEFQDIDWKTAGEQMVHPVLVDARNLLDPAEMLEAGFAYYAMGRKDAG
ncbi:MAG TPA: nucleotide sugar dehydrogenase, partial [Actinomycetota bacterium]|nr:nucleotide sugar dehydrogenase [Actinomycetota bacterium]